MVVPCLIPSGRNAFRPSSAAGAPRPIELWFQPCRLVAVDGAHLRVATPSQFARDRLLHEHLPALEAAARDVLGGRPRVSLEIDDSRPLAVMPSALDPEILPAQE